METRILFISIVAFYSQLVEGCYGEKINTDETENNISTEVFLEETVTVPDDGVTIEKAILAAEITPKASYNLVDPPKQSKESKSDLYTEAITGDDHQQGYPDSESPVSVEFGSRLKSSSSGGGSSSAGSDRFQFSKSYSDGEQNSHNDASSATNTEWDHPGSSSGSSYLDNNSFTSSTSYSDGDKNSYQESSSLSHSGWNHFGNQKDAQQLAPSSYQSNNYELVKANVNEINYDNYSPYDYVKKLNSEHKTRSSWTPYQTADNTAQLAKENEAKLRLEQERLYQIEAAKSYLNQIKAAQDYAAKVNQHSQWRPITSSNQGSSSYLPPTKSTVVPKNQAPGVSNFGSQNQRNLPKTYLPQTHYQSSHNTYNSWKLPSSLPGRPQGYAFYSGPTAVPVILPSGFIADTEEVVQARIAHLKAIMKAIKAASLWKDATALKQWQY